VRLIGLEQRGQQRFCRGPVGDERVGRERAQGEHPIA